MSVGSRSAIVATMLTLLFGGDFLRGDGGNDRGRHSGPRCTDNASEYRICRIEGPHGVVLVRRSGHS